METMEMTIMVGIHTKLLSGFMILPSFLCCEFVMQARMKEMQEGILRAINETMKS